MRRLRRHLIVAGGLVVSAVALWFVVQSVDVAEAVDVLGRADVVPLVAILGVVAVQAYVRAWRWSVLLPVAAGRRPTAARMVPPMLVGYLGNAILPARLGEPMRAVIAARRERIGTTEALGSVLVERLIDIAILAIVGSVAAFLFGAPAWAVQLLGVAAGVGAVGIVVLVTVGLEPVLRVAERLGLGRWPAIRDVAARFVATLGGRTRRGALLSAVGFSTVAWLLDATSFWLAGQAVGADLPYLGAMIVSAVSVMGTAVPSAPGFVGTFEFAAVGIAGALGMPGAEALALAIVVHAMTLVPLAIGGAVSLVAMGADLGEVAHAAEAQRGV